MRTDSLKLTKRPVNNAGFTLVEVMVAMAIFAFGVLAIAQLAHYSSTGNASARKLGEATRVGQRVMEELDLMLNFYYNEDEGVCNGMSFLQDPEPLLSGPDDSFCPNRIDDPVPGDDDLNTTKVKLAALIDSNNPLSYSFTLQEIANDADHCYPDKIGGISGNCPMVNAEGNYKDIDTSKLFKKRMYYVVWNLQASYPSAMMTSVRLYVMWEDQAMGGKRHYIILNSIITAKDDEWYK